MDGSSSRPRPHNPPLPPTPTLYQVPSASDRQRHYRSLLQDHALESSSSPALPPIPPIPSPPSYQQLYPYYTPPFVPGLDPSVDPIQHQPRIAQGQFVSVPEWQPDHLVRSCPICDNPFTLFFRRHHCRKCGRVVCAQCSSNRLSLPSSSVVRPPGEISTAQGLDGFGTLLGGPSPYNSPGTGTSNRHSWAGSITSPVEQNSSGFFDWGPNDVSSDGTEDVRVCTDCYAGCPPNENRSASAAGVSIHRTWNGSSSPLLQGRPSASELWATPGVNTPDAIGRRRRQSLQGGRSLPYNYDPSTPPTFHNRSTYIPEVSTPGSNYNPPPTSSSQPQHYGPPYSVAPHPHLQAKHTNNQNARMAVVGGSSRQVSSGVQIPSGIFSQRPQPRPEPSSQPQPVAPERALVRLKETDFCPICTLPLPPRDPETGDESERETHIQDCIRRHEAPSSPRGVNNAPTTASPHTGVARSAPAEMSVTEFLNQSKSGPGKPSGRMVVYKAREEDTWDYSSDDGEGVSSKNLGSAPPPPPDKNKHRKKAECVICFEEFEVGEAIARLECLCRYHKSCIREWFDRKGNGDCPVHAVRE